MLINDLSKGKLDVAGKGAAKIVNADGSSFEGVSNVVTEHHMDLYINERLSAKLVCTPSNLAEMVVGRLVTEGFIKDANDVDNIYICEQGIKAKIYLKENIVLEENIGEQPTCCTNNEIYLKKSEAERLRPLAKVDYTNETIFALAHEFANGSLIHKSTKGAHCCYLSYEGKPVYAAEDIGRHNALDKAIGHMIIEGYDISKCIVYTTGRVPTDMVKKVIASRIPILVSKAVPTDQSLKMAKKYNLTLICKAWPDRFEVFNEAE